MDRADRVGGVDLARGVGLLAVFVAHTAPITPSTPGALRVLLGSADYLAAPLFTLVLGVSLGLMASRATARAGSSSRDVAAARRTFRLRLSVRAGILVVVGLLLAASGAQVIPILHYFGVVYLVLLPLLFARARLIAVIAVIALVVGPIIKAATGPALIGWITASLESTATVPLGYAQVVALSGFFFDGYAYRVTGLLMFALVGLLISRVDLRSARRLALLALAGFAAAAAGYLGGTLATGTRVNAYDGTFVELLGASGLAVVVLAACCGLFVAADARGAAARASAVVVRLVSPVTVLGTMTLTFYVAHILVLAAFARIAGPGVSDDSWPMLAALVVGSLALAALASRTLGAGPLEWLIGTAAFGRRSRVRPAPLSSRSR